MIYDQSGNRKYLTTRERAAFIDAASTDDPRVETFCLTLAYTGARISEILSLRKSSVDFDAGIIVIESLKRRRSGVYRGVPVPLELLAKLRVVHNVDNLSANGRDSNLWTWSRTTAWSHVKAVMNRASIAPARAMPKALRHAFGVGAIEAGIPVTMLQKWLGHARLTTTAIYAEATGNEERHLAALAWAKFR